MPFPASAATMVTIGFLLHIREQVVIPQAAYNA
jgi:hypothetical protein